VKCSTSSDRVDHTLETQGVPTTSPSPASQHERQVTFTYPRRRASAWSATATVIACLLCAPRIPAAAQGDPGRPIAEDAKRSAGYSATASYVAGAADARMSLFPPKTRMQFRLDASTFQKTIPALAGPLTTRVLAEGVDYYSNATSRSRAVEAVGGATYLPTLAVAGPPTEIGVDHRHRNERPATETRVVRRCAVHIRACDSQRDPKSEA